MERKEPLMIAGGITQDELRTAIIKCSEEKKSLIEQVLGDERVSEEGLADSIASYLRFPRINLPATNIDPEAVKLLPQETARKHLCIPVRLESRQVHLAIANPTDYSALQDIQFVLGRTVKIFVATRTEILDAIEKNYQTEDTLRSFTDNLDAAMDVRISSPDSDTDVDLSRSLSASELPPVVKVVNLMIQDAITQGATDIHVEPTLNDLQVRFRVDGVLRPVMQLPKWLINPICSRLKVLSRLDIAERRLPQDGRIKVNTGGQGYDFRVSTLPTLFGEKVVLRILSTESSMPTLDKLGLDEQDRRVLLHALMQPQGLILVTGPTGSGKTTTLVSCLGHRKSPGLNIITVEDPVEYQIPGINQVQVNTKTGLTFASALRSILRQDPDIVLVGEMRDLETSEIAFHAAMTGHLVLSTLHTNSAIASLSRLLDLGVEPVLINSALTLVIAQRLLRKLCRECKQPYEPPARTLQKLGITKEDTIYYQPVGCPKCGQTGFSGRIAVLEFLSMTKAVREMVAIKASDVEIKTALRNQGVRFLLDRGLELVRKGTTDVSELFRVLQLEDEEEAAGPRCHNCRATIEPGFTICPNCLIPLTIVCAQCRQELKKDWRICPFCKSPVSESLLQLPPAQVAESKVETARSAGDGKSIGETAAPFPHSAEKAEAGPPSGAAPAAKKPKILIVDDDASIRIIVRKALEQLPFPIETQMAADGFEAIRRVEEFRPDLIVLDVMMPGMDGFGVCNQLRTQVKTAFIPIMMLTANSSEEGRTRGYLVGADDYVAKPFSVPELNARVTRLLRRNYGL
ncbi:MAG: Flp pilus assembly complex ATPase component TadA [Acidobacteria bacterium]|nr:Flp pilus assembly complex ATPase component TadA [Acidobacteriota bacterium]